MGKSILSFAAPPPRIMSLVITPGDSFDYVGMDNIDRETPPRLPRYRKPARSG